jgi:class 3 adenylate cyclase
MLPFYKISPLLIYRAVTDALVAKHGGRIVKTTGDGVLLEFPSVVDAVECAVAMQAVMAERNEGVPAERGMLFRIGINLGDILIEGDDILGDGVNVAARLEGVAEPGGICISSFAYEEVRGKVTVEFADLGEQRLKNIDRPDHRSRNDFCRLFRAASAIRGCHSLRA